MWRSLASAYGAYFGLLMAIAVGFEIGEDYPNWTPERLWSSDTDMFPGMRLAGFLLILSGVIALVQVVVARHRAARQYLRAEEITSGRIVVVNPDQSRSIQSAQGQLKIPLGGWLALTAFSLGAYVVTVLVTATIVSGAFPLKPGDPYLPYLILGLSFGSVLTVFGGLSVLPLVQNEKRPWKHPRALEKSASIIRTDVGPDHRKQEIRPAWWRVGKPKKSPT